MAWIRNVPTFDPDHVTLQDAKTGELPERIREQVITETKHGSAFMQLANEESITKPVEHFYKMTGIGAYWVDEAERIQTSKPTWTKVTINTKKLAVIIPTSQENLDYSVTDFFNLMRPEIVEAFAKKIDAACIANINNPFNWSISQAAINSGNVLTETANKYDDLNEAMGLIEGHDFDPNGIVSLRKQKRKYRATKDENGLPIFHPATAGVPAELVGLPMTFMHNMAFGGSPTIAEIVGNWDYVFYGILQNIRYKILDQATLTTVEADDAPGIPLALAERDMVALRATMEVGLIVMEEGAFAMVEMEPEGP